MNSTRGPRVGVDLVCSGSSIQDCGRAVSQEESPHPGDQKEEGEEGAEMKHQLTSGLVNGNLTNLTSLDQHLAGVAVITAHLFPSSIQ